MYFRVHYFASVSRLPIFFRQVYDSIGKLKIQECGDEFTEI